LNNKNPGVTNTITNNTLIMKNLFYTLFAGLVLFSCQQQEPDISTEKSEVQLSLRDIFFGEAGSAGGRVNAITWAHVLGGNGSITFDNVDNDYTASYALDGSNLGAGTYSIPNGNYDITVDLNSVTPADYLPYTASLLGQSISSSQTLTFDAVTTFGLVLLGLDSVDQAVTPTFNLSSTDYDLTLDAVQEFYYLYVPGATTGTLTATETFYDQSLSLEVNVSTSTTHAYAFKISSSDAGIGVNFTDFTVVESDWDIDGITVLPAAIGDFAHGGVVYYIYQSGDLGYIEGEEHGLVVDVVNLTEPEWGTSGVVLGTTSSSLGSGAANTQAIVSYIGAGSYTAQVCNDLVKNGYNDWFLPSKDELNLMYQNRAAIDATASSNGGYNLTLNSYWSSTEASIQDAWVHNFSSGAQHGYFKFSDTPLCRAVRAF
jgi:hypothetical protein